ncbi:MAG TPA: hypothetical protein VFU71_02160 [Burkholderiaceae bacterium]|nr:hypothetical protein [Burkholderiaceae bacterium]
MARWRMLAVAAALAGAAAADELDAPARARAAVDAAIGASLGADTAQALADLNRVPTNEFEGRDAIFRACMNARFAAQPAAEKATAVADPFTASVIATFRAYWRDALLHPQDLERAEGRLFANLQRQLRRTDVADLSSLEPLLKARLAAAGFHALLGVTSPLRELMLWRHEEKRAYRVKLPDGVHATRVVVLSDFVVLGWADFATCGRRGAGGWTTRDALYVVAPRYRSLEDETFRVSFLGHEAQHFADLARFPGMPSWELEYRAKLVELSLADATRADLLVKFAEDQGDDETHPHSYANKRVLATMRTALGLADGADLASVTADAMRAAARAALREDTKRRSS